jgi:hypothetical protein
MKGIERQDNLVLSDQFIAELFHAQAALYARMIASWSANTF